MKRVLAVARAWLQRISWFRGRASVPTTGSHDVIVSDDGAFAVWPVGGTLPAGWRFLGKRGSQEELLAYLQQEQIETSPAPLLVTDPRRPG